MADNGHLTSDEFLTKLASLFDTRRSAAHGSVHLTQKRFPQRDDTETSAASPDPQSLTFPDQNPSSTPAILIRASDGRTRKLRAEPTKPGESRWVKNGDKLKLSTVVQAKDLPAFYAKYADVCKVGMSGLKKRDRSGRKAKEKEKKRKLQREREREKEKAAGK